MLKRTEINAKSRERETAEEIWLMYFNNYLFENGVITETERNRMISRIVGRKKAGSAKTAIANSL